MSNLVYYKLNEFHNNFSYGESYIRYADGNEIKTGLYINNYHQLECLPDRLFDYSKTIYAIKNVVCIFTPDSSFKLRKIYPIYKADNENYLILNENLKLTDVNKEFFIDEDDWILLSYKGKDNIISEYTEKLNKEQIEKQKKIEEQKLKEEKEIELSNKLQLIRNIFSSINNSLHQDKIITKIFMPKRIKLFYYMISFIGLLFGVCFKQIGLILFCLLFLVCNFILLRTYKKEKDKEEFEVDINNYERLQFQNKLPIEILGKIKKIENELIILNYKKIDSSILDLLKQSVNLTIYVSTNEEYYLENKEELDSKLQEFLNNTLSYIKTLKDNQEIESNYIGVEISKNIIGMIDKNNELFKSMIKYNHYLTDIYKEL